MNHPKDRLVRTSTDVTPHPVIQYIGHSCFLSLRGGQNGIYRGINKIFAFKIGPTKIVHLGELGKIELPKVYEPIKDADVMLVSAGQVGAMSFDQLNEWAGSLRSEIDAWIDLWKYRPNSSCNQN